MDAALLGAIAIVVAVVGVCGVVVPVLPGSLLVGLGLALWSVGHRSPLDWLLFGVGVVVLVIGSLTGALLTKRQLADRRIPHWPVVVGLVAGVAGMVFLPGPGLLIGFVVGLFVAELVRVRTPRAALSTSWVALKSVGLGMLIELACDLAVTAALVVRVLTVA
ncbi:MAG TPA: DUF456 domain-containing protein [Propionibacteriaceae bacterium]|nr:DUF456 domain-containing protein [Propionibacteriaceae bacterium]